MLTINRPSTPKLDQSNAVHFNEPCAKQELPYVPEENEEIEGNLGTLIKELKVLLGKKGLASEEIDHNKIIKLMESIPLCEDDWSKFARHDSSRNYSRNGIVNINDNANLLILCWSPGKGSAIHDHAKAHCIMKVLKGNLQESLYNFKDDKISLMKESVLNSNDVGYISDDIGLHKISNPDSTISVSLHLYTPPYASLYGCSMYDLNGKKHHVDMSKYYSWRGKLVNKVSSTC